MAPRKIFLHEMDNEKTKEACKKKEKKKYYYLIGKARNKLTPKMEEDDHLLALVTPPTHSEEVNATLPQLGNKDAKELKEDDGSSTALPPPLASLGSGVEDKYHEGVGVSKEATSTLLLPSPPIHAVGGRTDVAVLEIQDKEEAKKKLNREEYKLWKKTFKKMNKREREQKKKKREREKPIDNEEEEEDEGNMEKRERKRHRHHRHHRGSGGGDVDDEEEDEEEDSRRSRRSVSSDEKERSNKAKRRGREKGKKRKSKKDEESTRRQRRRKESKRSRRRHANGENSDELRMSDDDQQTLADMFADSEMKVNSEEELGEEEEEEGEDNQFSGKRGSRTSSLRRQGGTANELSSMPIHSRKSRQGADPIKPKKSTDFTPERLSELATALLEKMKKAQEEDDKCITNLSLYGPPLHRIALSDEVAAMFSKKGFLEYFLEGGKGLDLLARWLLESSHRHGDGEEGEERNTRKNGIVRLGSLELRTKALNILLGIPLSQSGEEEEAEDERRMRDGRRGGGCHLHQQRPSVGYTRENLMNTDLGRAVNIVRQHAHETPENRAKCAALLERFSRAFSAHLQVSTDSGGCSGSGMRRRGRRDGLGSRLRDGSDGVTRPTAVNWKCRSQADVASPFQNVPTAGEEFQKDFMRPNPRDPASYLNLPPPRLPVRVVTNLSGHLAEQFAQKFRSA